MCTTFRCFTLGMSALFLFVFLCCDRLIGVSASSKADADQQPEQHHRTFQSADTTVHVVSNFLPHDLAVKWRDAMRNEWLATTTAPSSSSGDDSSTSSTSTCTGSSEEEDGTCLNQASWMYATNNDGNEIVQKTNNAKVRSLENIDARNVTAQKLRAFQQFSYAKWELDPSHALVNEMEEAFSSEEMRTRITNIIEGDNFSNHGHNRNGVVRLAPELSDLFVTQYSAGDFLTPHDDGVCGNWAFVVSLMDGPGEEEWNVDDFGGTLRFECPLNHVKYRQQNGMRRPYQWCESLSPSFNSLLLFRTYSSDGKKITTGPFHEVLPVKWKAAAEGFHRFGATGWYMDMNHDMPDLFLAERDKMRAK